MKHIESVTENIPWFAVDRRNGSDRRGPWRGGRRDSDWINRPQGALSQLNMRTTWFAILRRRWVPRPDAGRGGVSH
jgi:hypothetical protein